MASSFNSLPQSASRSAIYSQAGRIFAEQVINDPATDYTHTEEYNVAIWNIAEKAQDRGFSALRGMTKRDIASGIGNQIAAYRSHYRSYNTLNFGSLPQNAPRSAICEQAGRMLEEQIINDPGTDYAQAEAYNTAVWHIAEEARGRGFFALQGMATRQVASDIGNYLSAYVKAQKPGSVAPLVYGFLGGALGVAAVATAHFWLPVVAMKAAALAHTYPGLTADAFITAAGRVINGDTPTNVAKAVAQNAVIGVVVEQPLTSWLAGLKTH